MSRKPRFNLPGVAQHIIQRGNNREPCFYSLDDYHKYLTLLAEVSTANNCHIHSYVLMTNHVHILLTPNQPNAIAHMIQDLGRKYVRYINKTYKRSGTLWEGRYKSSLIDSEAYLLICMRYIEMNPVRAGMVKHPGEYQWSSYSVNAYNKVNDVLHQHPLYIALGESIECRIKAYRSLFENYLSAKDVHIIREALNQELVLGRDDFKDKIEQMTKRQTRPGINGRPAVKDEQGEYFRF